MLRRQFIAGGLSLPSTAIAAAQAPPSFPAYAARLRASVERAGDGRFAISTEDALFAEHQHARQAAGLSGLARHDGLAAAARAHAADLVLRNYLEHHSPEGFGPSERVGLMARTFIGLPGENIVQYQGRALGGDSTALMASWLQSARHRANIMKPSYTHLGLGVVQSAGRVVGVAVFGQLYSELPANLPFEASRGEIVLALSAAYPVIDRFDLAPVGLGDPPKLAPGLPLPAVRPGVYALKPWLSEGERFTVVEGPIVELRV